MISFRISGTTIKAGTLTYNYENGCLYLNASLARSENLLKLVRRHLNFFVQIKVVSTCQGGIIKQITPWLG